MTIALPVYRGVSTKFAGRSFQVVTRWGYNPWLARVDQTHDAGSSQTQSRKPSSSNSFQYLASRGYATTARPRPAGRPKATTTTTRTPAKRSTKSTAKKPGPKTAAGKKNVGRKPKAKPKARSKATKAATAPKTRVRRPVSKSALNAKRIAEEKALREKALLNEPKLLPATPWALVFSEAHAKKQSLVDSQNATKEAAQRLKNLTPEEREYYNHEAHIAKDKNDKAHKQWLSQFTPEQIRDANNARNQLKKLDLAKRPNRKHKLSKYSPLKDDRLVKRPLSSFVFFTRARHASGDFVGMKVAEAGKLIGREWKALSNKKPYEDQAEAEKNRYLEEYRSVYGKDPVGSGKKSG